MLLLKKTYWTPLKLLGIFGFYISSTSLLGWYAHSASEFPAQTGIGFFDIYPLFEGIIGSTTALLFFVVLFFVSLYLVFHISYRKILGRTYAHISQVAQNSIITRNERSETPTKERPSRESSTKTQKIEAELEAIQSKKKRIDAPEKPIESPTTSENTGAKIIGNLFGKGSVQHETKIPVHDKSGKIIESPKIKEDSTPKVSKPISGWDFPSVELLNKPRKANPISPEEIREKALIIQKTLLQFGIEVEMERECV